MAKPEKDAYKQLMNPENLTFNEVENILRRYGFQMAAMSQLHHVFVHDKLPELLSLQNVSGRCKPYQIRRVRYLIQKYHLKVEPKKS